MSSTRDKVAVFWDFENCAPPSQVSGYDAVDAIRRVGHRYGAICQLKAYLEPPRQYVEPTAAGRALALRSELQASGVSLTDCPHNGMKEVADHMMQVDMLAFALDHPAPATILIITGDRDFAYATAVLRARRYCVVVLSLPHIHNSLKAQADEWLEWGAAVRAAEERRKAKMAIDSESSEDEPRSTTRGRTTRASSMSSVTSTMSSLSFPSSGSSDVSFPVSDDRDMLITPPLSPPSMSTPPSYIECRAPSASAFQTREVLLRRSVSPGYGQDPAPGSTSDDRVDQLAKALLECSPCVSDLLCSSPWHTSCPLTEAVQLPSTTSTKDDPVLLAPQPVPSEAAAIYKTSIIPSTQASSNTVVLAPAFGSPASPPAPHPASKSQPSAAASLPTPAATPSSTLQGEIAMAACFPAQPRIVPQNFAVLVSILQDLLASGKQRPLRLDIARLLNQRDAMVYRRMNVTNCKQYLAQAAQEGFVTLGETSNGSLAWAELKEEWRTTL